MCSGTSYGVFCFCKEMIAVYLDNETWRGICDMNCFLYTSGDHQLLNQDL
jgi:hypothetical protein